MLQLWAGLNIKCNYSATFPLYPVLNINYKYCPYDLSTSEKSNECLLLCVCVGKY